MPRRATPVDQLEPGDVAHTEVLRLDQDFHPNDDYEIAVDAWNDRSDPASLELVRMWWVDTAKADERSPFGRGVRRHIDIQYSHDRPDAWTIRIEQGGSVYAFEVELDSGSGKVQAFGDVVTEAGDRLSRCPIQRSRLVAKKFLGIPTGLDRLDVVCTDEGGQTHAGRLARQ